jgi:hypothetical protein
MAQWPYMSLQSSLGFQARGHGNLNHFSLSIIMISPPLGSASSLINIFDVVFYSSQKLFTSVSQGFHALSSSNFLFVLSSMTLHLPRILSSFIPTMRST